MEFAREMGADRGAKAQQICVEDGEERELEETLKVTHESDTRSRYSKYDS